MNLLIKLQWIRAGIIDAMTSYHNGASRDMAASRADLKIDWKKSRFMLKFNIHGLLPLDNEPKTCKMKKQYFMILF
jgi:hypothetical protein